MELSMVIIFFFTWTPTYIYTDKIPPVLLKPFRTTKDIRYSQFIIPKKTLIERLSFSLVLDRLCLPDNFTAVFRPHALPLVAPFGLKIPSSAVLHSDFFNVEVNLRDDPTVEITSAFPLSYIQAWVSRNGYFASLEVKISSPCSGLWFMGSLFTDSSFNKDCKLLVFAQNSHEIALDSQNTIVFHKSSGSTLTTNNLPARSGNAIFSTVETKGFSSTPKFSDSRSSWLSGYRSLRSPNTRVTNKQGWTGIESHRRVYRDRVSDDSSYAEKSKLNSTLPCAHSVQFSATNSMAMRRIMRSDPSASAKLVVHLHPSEGRLFQ
ncbi:hypothetical protein D915_009854 [Fasciola hepatica]|uniref:Uncharacterized protein n=1 Tax=Fasciola hepatica TaxID=6192 RepID=A0A4E0RN09_FASHE|nr:hypothetical protein D915_009854 [Fasciola hepatica]